MKCPKCNAGELQESYFDECIGECDNLDCGATFKGRKWKRIKFGVGNLKKDVVRVR